MLLYKVVFLHSFGKAAKRPYRTATTRVGTLLMMALGIGLFLAFKMPPLPHIAINQLHLVYSAIFVSQIVVSLSLFASFGVLRAYHKDRFISLMLMLPIPRWRVWFVLLSPGFIICILSTALFGPLVYNLLTQLGIAPFICLLAIAIGNLTALGLAFGLKKGITTYIAVPLLYFLEYKSLTYLHSSYTSQLNSILVQTLLGIIFLLCICLFGYSKKHILNEAAAPGKVALIRTTFFPTSVWFAKKIVRTSSLRIGFYITLAMATALAFIGEKLALDEIYLGGCGALIAAVLAADLRTTTRRYRPPEIFGIKGTKTFEYSQLAAGICLCIVAASPVLITSYLSASSATAMCSCALAILFGISAGLFAGTLVAPEPHDVVAQMCATILSIGVLCLLYAVKNVPTLALALTELGLTILLVIGGIVIEYKRNHFYWKELHE